MTQGSDRPRRTVHAAASAKLNGDKILPVDCEFEGDAQFPNCMEDD